MEERRNLTRERKHDNSGLVKRHGGASSTARAVAYYRHHQPAANVVSEQVWSSSSGGAEITSARPTRGVYLNLYWRWGLPGEAATVL